MKNAILLFMMIILLTVVYPAKQGIKGPTLTVQCKAHKVNDHYVIQCPKVNGRAIASIRGPNEKANNDK